jgi:hypothetical protein
MSKTADNKPESGRNNPEVVARWVSESHARRAGMIQSAAEVEDAWKHYKQDVCGLELHNRKGERTTPTPAGFALYLNFCTERGLDHLAERGEEFARVVAKIRAECIELVVAQLLKRGGNCIGAIFWLKNKAGFRDKSVEEANADREDWLTRLQANAGSPDRSDTPPRTDSDAQPLALQDDNPDSDTPAEPVMRVV